MEVEALVSLTTKLVSMCLMTMFRGCVSPKQIENIIEQLGGLDGLDLDKDLDILDGYDELPTEYQDKIKYALQNGHVNDEDWKGVSLITFCLGLVADFNRTQS